MRKQLLLRYLFATSLLVFVTPVFSQELTAKDADRIRDSLGLPKTEGLEILVNAKFPRKPALRVYSPIVADEKMELELRKRIDAWNTKESPRFGNLELSNEQDADLILLVYVAVDESYRDNSQIEGRSSPGELPKPVTDFIPVYSYFVTKERERYGVVWHGKNTIEATDIVRQMPNVVQGKAVFRETRLPFPARSVRLKKEFAAKLTDRLFKLMKEYNAQQKGVHEE